MSLEFHITDEKEALKDVLLRINGEDTLEGLSKEQPISDDVMYQLKTLFDSDFLKIS